VTDHPTDPMSGPQGPVDYEPGDVAPGAIVRFAIILFVSTGVVAATLLVLMLGLKKQEAAHDVPPPPLAVSGERQPVGPQLQTTPLQDLATFRAQERQVLTTYGWVDRQGGIVRVPIREAMRMYLQKYGAAGAPAVAPSPPAPPPAASAAPAGDRP
jgi:hypothetical protein